MREQRVARPHAAPYAGPPDPAREVCAAADVPAARIPRWGNLHGFREIQVKAAPPDGTEMPAFPSPANDAAGKAGRSHLAMLA
jgi:hypothetical protein